MIRTPAHSRTQAQSKNCPVCERPSAARYAPFCSKRCSDVDLGRWLNEDYAIPVSPEEDEAPAVESDEDSDET